jgi:peptide/nickel transport system permease protein
MARVLAERVDVLPKELAEPRPEGWRLLRRYPLAAAAATFLVILHILVFAMPLVYHTSPTYANPLITLAPPGPGHLLGTDELGRDELARLIYGGRVSLLVGLFAMAVSVTVGTFIGAVSGFFRGATELALMRVVDAVMAIPAIFLILVEISVFGSAPVVIVLAVGLTYWPQVARIVHAEVLKWRERDFVEASYAVGAKPARILLRHVLPQAVPSILSLAILSVGWSILTESALSYLGLGIQPPLASWGAMLQDAQTYIFADPALAVFPGALIFLTILSYNFVGNGLSDYLSRRSG